MIKKAYMQGEVEFEDGDNGEEGAASPRNVGHNIYILAHQVGAPAPRPARGHAPSLPGAFSEGWLHSGAQLWCSASDRGPEAQDCLLSHCAGVTGLEIPLTSTHPGW